MSCDTQKLEFYACVKDAGRVVQIFIATVLELVAKSLLCLISQTSNPQIPPQHHSCMLLLYGGLVYSETLPHSEPAGNDGEVQQLTSCQMIEQNLEEMIAEMNAKRSRDQSLLESMYASPYYSMPCSVNMFLMQTSRRSWIHGVPLRMWLLKLHYMRRP